MEVRKIKNNKGEVLVTKKGIEMEELKFEEGDEFVPLRNKVFERVNEAIVRGKPQQITNYSIICKSRDKNKKPFIYKDQEGNPTDEVFVAVTPTQAKVLKEKIASGMDITQHVFNAYKYISKQFKTECIGVGLKKDFKKPITFEEFDEKGPVKEPTEETTSEDKPVEGAKKVDSDNEFSNEDLSDIDAELADI